MTMTTVVTRPWQAFADTVAARTPASRDRALDAYRALATLGVVTGHWLVGALVAQPDGTLRIASPLRDLGALAPASWVLQMLGLFFLVGGHAAVSSLARSAERGEPYGTWLRRRFARLARPVLAATALSAGCLAVLGAVGVPEGTLRTWVVLLVQPFWFVAVYAVLTVLTRYAVAADRRWRGWAVLPLLAVVAATDLARYGPWSDAVPGWVGLVNLVPGWLFAYQLGVSWGRGTFSAASLGSKGASQGRFGRWAGWLLLVGGATLFAVLLVVFHYPASMVGVPGAARSNAHPPSLLVPALAAFQSGAALLLHGPVTRLMRRPGLWAGVAAVNLAAMTIFCWHQVPMVLVSLAGKSAIGAVPGLTTSPDQLSWVLARVAWLPVMAAVLVAVVAATRRFEAPLGLRAPLPRVGAAVVTAAAVGFFVSLY
ncbi:acyltransferase family protein [Actinopolymorpha singaporensis]